MNYYLVLRKLHFFHRNNFVRTQGSFLLKNLEQFYEQCQPQYEKNN